MKPSELRILLNEMIKNKVKVTPFIWGQHGIGKSSIAKQAAKEAGYNILTLILSQKESVDLAGIPYIFEDTYTGEKVTCNYTPNWFNEALKKGKLLLFLDEFNMARRETMAAAFELVLDRRLNNIYLPDDVLILAAGNPEDDRYSCTPMSESLNDRFMHIHLQPEVTEWVSWAKENQVHSDIVDFIQSSQTSLYTKDDRDSKFPVTIKHSARSWGDRADAIWKLNLPDSIKQECLIGIVGLENTSAFIKSLEANQDRPIAGDKALNDLKNTKKKFEKWGNKRSDLISSTVQNVLEVITKDKNNVFSEDSILEFTLLLPEDLVIKFLVEQSAFENNKVAVLIVNKKIKEIINSWEKLKNINEKA